MTFWLDAHLDPELAAWLGSHFRVIAKSFDEIGLRHASDQQICDAARRFKQIVVVTKDTDYAEIITRTGAPPQIVWLRVGNTSTPVLQGLLLKVFSDVLERLDRGDMIVKISEYGIE